MRIGELFSGYGGLGAGVQAVLGGSIAWHSEIDPGACKILAHRYPDVPNHGDITAIDWSSVEPVDVLTGGSPCQDLSAAGKRAGMTEGTRSNLWVSMREAIAQLRPGLVVWENVRGALSARASSDMELAEGRLGVGDDGPVLRALGRVLGDLADLGYDASWQGLRASDVGAPHGRFRVFVIAWPVADASGQRRQQRAGQHDGPPQRLEGDGQPRRLTTAADAPCHGRSEGWPQPARLVRGSDASLGGTSTVADADSRRLEGRRLHAEREGERTARPGRVAAAADTNGTVVRLESVPVAGRSGPPIAGHAGIEWGAYADAVRRWERVTRPAPAPTEPNKKGQPRLSPRFVEWLMGLPAGWVTDVPGLSRNEQLRALGNGVCPPQAAEALRLLLPDIEVAAA